MTTRKENFRFLLLLENVRHVDFSRQAVELVVPAQCVSDFLRQLSFPLHGVDVRAALARQRFRFGNDRSKRVRELRQLRQRFAAGGYDFVEIVTRVSQAGEILSDASRPVGNGLKR